MGSDNCEEGEGKKGERMSCGLSAVRRLHVNQAAAGESRRALDFFSFFSKGGGGCIGGSMSMWDVSQRAARRTCKHPNTGHTRCETTIDLK
ncbi:Hypothetical protein SMAX5B_001344, partial [Scophthalmus maximus]